MDLGSLGHSSDPQTWMVVEFSIKMELCNVEVSFIEGGFRKMRKWEIEESEKLEKSETPKSRSAS